MTKKKFKLKEYNKLEDMTKYNLGKRDMILAKCKECCGFDGLEYHLCMIKTCPLYSALNNYLKNSNYRKEFLETNNYKVD